MDSGQPQVIQRVFHERAGVTLAAMIGVGRRTMPIQARSWPDGGGGRHHVVFLFYTEGEFTAKGERSFPVRGGLVPPGLL